MKIDCIFQNSVNVFKGLFDVSELLFYRVGAWFWLLFFWVFVFWMFRVCW